MLTEKEILKIARESGLSPSETSAFITFARAIERHAAGKCDARSELDYAAMSDMEDRYL